jgi:hypothetical protein
VGFILNVVEQASEWHLVGLVVDVSALALSLRIPPRSPTTMTAFLGILHDVSSNLVEAVVLLPGFGVPDTSDHPLSLSGFGLPDGLSQLLVVFADTAHFFIVEGGFAVGEEHTGNDVHPCR